MITVEARSKFPFCWCEFSSVVFCSGLMVDALIVELHGGGCVNCDNPQLIVSWLHGFMVDACKAVDVIIHEENSSIDLFYRVLMVPLLVKFWNLGLLFVYDVFKSLHCELEILEENNGSEYTFKDEEAGVKSSRVLGVLSEERMSRQSSPTKMDGIVTEDGEALVAGN